MKVILHVEVIKTENKFTVAAANETGSITERNIAERLPETETNFNNRLEWAGIGVEIATVIPGESDHRSKNGRE